jgi:hypothetical protein
VYGGVLGAAMDGRGTKFLNKNQLFFHLEAEFPVSCCEYVPSSALKRVINERRCIVVHPQVIVEIFRENLKFSN